MNKNKKRQTGITLISLLIMLAIALFVVSTTIKILPAYIENLSVKTSLASIAEEINAKKIKPAEIKDKLIKRLGFNNVTRISKENIMISGGKDDTTTLSIKYEVRKPIIGNIDFVMSFHNSQAIDF